LHIRPAALLTIVALSMATAQQLWAGTVDTHLTIRGDAALGGFKTSGRFSDALRVFGSPTRKHDLALPPRGCRATWAEQGLTAVFDGDGCTAKSAFVRATATGGRWRTLRGLAVGQSLSQLLRRYSDATPEGKGRWSLLRRGGRTTLGARVNHNRVASFDISAGVTSVRW
jgi:hypothetical protein